MNEIDVLTAVLNELKSLKENINKRFDQVNERFDKVEARLDKVEARLDKLEQDNESIKHTCHLVESDWIPKIQVLLEAHCDLSKNVMVAKNVEERVGVLEFEVKIIKGLLQAK